MKDRIRQALYESVHLHNILPLTSACNVSCLFCSHRQNPPGLEAYAIPHLSPGEAEELSAFLSPDRKIIIGESATKIMEGEPFCNPDCLEILSMLRQKFPFTPLQVTTNGSLLTPETAKRLKMLEPLEINLSLNSSDPKMRRLLMSEAVRTGCPDSLLPAGCGVAFHGSIVPLPWLTGWHDIAETISFQARGAVTVRIFLPGFTCCRRRNLLPPCWEEELITFTGLRNRTGIPLTMSPGTFRPAAADHRGCAGQ